MTVFNLNFSTAVHQFGCLKVNDLTRNITNLEKELAEKERYVALSQMRLGNRAQRVGIELCKDRAQETLMRELMALKDTYSKLSHMIDQVRSLFNWKSFSILSARAQKLNINLSLPANFSSSRKQLFVTCSTRRYCKRRK